MLTRLTALCSKKVVRMATSTAKSSCSMSTLARMRRENNRKNLKVENEDPEWIDPNYERLGNDTLLNWELNKFNVTPVNDAYRNVYLKFLLMHTKGKLDKSKALHVSGKQTKFSLQLVETDKVAVPQGNKTNANNFKKFGRLISDHLTFESSALFVHDGAVGSHSSTDARVRVITDDANVALYMRNIIHPIPLKSPELFDPEIVVYVSPSFPQKELAEAGFTSESGAAVDLERGVVLVAGPTPFETIRNAIATAATYKLAKKHNALALNAHTLVDTNGNAALVFDPSNVLLQSKPDAKVAGAHGSVWGTNGLYQLFQGVTHRDASSAKVAGAIVENVGKTSNVTVAHRGPANAFSHPKSIVILSKDASGALPVLSRVDAATGLHHLSVGYNAETDSYSPFFFQHPTVDTGLSASFNELVKAANPTFYVLNAGAKDVTADALNQLLGAVLDGSADKAATTENKTLKASVVTSLPNVKINLSSKDDKGAKDLAKKLQL
jgi:ATP-dependent phosphoenolpyruvate carboxykinase